ncbi:MAG: purine-nucleoside phosphorylase, partial [Ktedonobacterales bacterium]|nr:purine-nucleoside phosphorylase [Ktedonobacterales bacterium]
MSEDASAPPAYERARAAAATILSHAATPPRIAIVLGTGLGGLAARIANPVELPYARIPHFPGTTVAGHAGTLV